MKTVQGFKNFLMQGNVIIAAIGLAIALAFSTLVKAFTDNIITPLVNAAGGGGTSGLGFHIKGQLIDIGAFISAIIYFAIFMAVVYFLIVVPYRAYEAPPRQHRVRPGGANADLPGVPVERPAGEGDPLQVLHRRSAALVRGRGRLTAAVVGAGGAAAQPSCAVGRIRISLTSTWGGWETAHITARATSSACNGSCRAVVEERRVGHPRLDQRHPDAGAVELLAGALAHRGDRPLGRGVQRAGHLAPSGDRAGDQQVTLGLAQRVDRGPDRQRRPVDVGQHHRAPVFDGLVREAPLGAEAGVGEHDVEPSEPLERELAPSPAGHPTRSRRR